uniref:Ig-like domain-containing protein n=1 Tax=Romanomermis culicivorax TaxID=13658 RepID=A0A915J678_ROMCU
MLAVGWIKFGSRSGSSRLQLSDVYPKQQIRLDPDCGEPAILQCKVKALSGKVRIAWFFENQAVMSTGLSSACVYWIRSGLLVYPTSRFTATKITSNI